MVRIEMSAVGQAPSDPQPKDRRCIRVSLIRRANDTRINSVDVASAARALGLVV